MGIEKRYFDEAAKVIHFLSANHNEELNSAFIRIEDYSNLFCVNLNAHELKEFICDLNCILKQIERNELH